MEREEITSEEFIRRFVPGAGYVLIQKDPPPDKYGALYVPATVQDRQVRHTGTGTIVATSPFLCESEQDRYLQKLWQVGDSVGFNSAVPHVAPTPTHYAAADGKSEAFVVIHIADILCYNGKTGDDATQFIERVISRSHDGNIGRNS